MRSIGSNRFKIDQHYVGEPPAIEITITNLNDNIDKNFLADLMSKCGATEEQIIYYHPLTKRHLGIARCVFMEVRAAQTCIDKYNGKSVMGKVLNVFHDAFGEHCKQFVLEASGEKKQTLPFQANAMHMMQSNSTAHMSQHPLPPQPPSQPQSQLPPPPPNDEYSSNDMSSFKPMEPYHPYGHPGYADNVDGKGKPRH